MKFNIEKYTGNYVMHCKTEEEARDFCKYLDSIGRTWLNGAKYVDNSHWFDYGPNTTYWFNSGLYDCIEYATDYATILEWSDFMEEESNCLKENNNRVNEVFKLLGVLPEEIFKVNNIYSADYKIDKDLRLFIEHEDGQCTPSAYTIADFLNGSLTICKPSIPTEMEQLAIDYALACDCHWLAKDQDGAIYAYKEKPEKNLLNGVMLIITLKEIL